MSVVIASILKYAHQVSREKGISFSAPLEESMTLCNFEVVIAELYPILCEFLKEAEISWERQASKGVKYDLAKDSIQHFYHWEQMYWE